MAIIELNLEKPALKRTETITGDANEDESRVDGADLEQETSRETESSGSTIEVTNPETDSGGGSASGRIGRVVRIIGIVGMGIIGAVTLRKLRARRTENRDTADTEV